MSEYFSYLSKELAGKLAQIRQYIKKHNPTIGLLTEEILRDFLRMHLPKIVSVEQGFIMGADGRVSKQCDIIIYNSLLYAPFYRINDIVVVPKEAVIAVIEVKTTMNKSIFGSTIDYFRHLSEFIEAPMLLFIYGSCSIYDMDRFFQTYKHPSDYQHFDHDTFYFLPAEITVLENSFHLARDYVITDRDCMGYISYQYEDNEGGQVNALEQFYISIYDKVEREIVKCTNKKVIEVSRKEYFTRKAVLISGIQLFDM